MTNLGNERKKDARKWISMDVHGCPWIVGVNELADNAVRGFVQNGTRNIKLTVAFGRVVDYRMLSGIGVRFSARTGKFITFLSLGVN
jgi:hypothetical protein